MAGSLGVSTLVCLLNNGDRARPKRPSRCLVPSGASTRRALKMAALSSGPIRRVLRFSFTRGCMDGHGSPIAGAEVDVWHASPVGLYENQDPDQAEMNLRGKFTTDADGRFWFSTVKMVGYPIPVDGVVGRLLKRKDAIPIARRICTR